MMKENRKDTNMTKIKLTDNLSLSQIIRGFGD